MGGEVVIGGQEGSGGWFQEVDLLHPRGLQGWRGGINPEDIKSMGLQGAPRVDEEWSRLTWQMDKARLVVQAGRG